MRIALTHAYSWPEVRRGAERILVETSAALAARGHRVTVMTSAWRRPPAQTVADGVELVCLRRREADRGLHERDFARRLVRRLAVRRFDAVHSLGARDADASVYASRLHPRRTTVYECMGVPVREWWDAQPEKVPHERVVEGVDVYGCMSRYALGRLEADYGRRGEWIPGGVSLDEFRPGARTDRPTLLFSGAVDEPRKGLATLLDALALLARDEPSVRLWISGPGDPSALLERAPREARERAEVLPLGGPGEQAARYASAWATVLPSTHEVFGLAIVESLASGTPVAGTTHAAIPELVTASTGALCEPGDAEGLAAACRHVLGMAQDPSTADACRESVRPFDWRTGLAPRLEALYEGGSCR